ncbi:type II/IV secretion system ATPase subunit [Candidatus Bathyarchaeota archaeon]|nr:type II/IV secretion system ATPase subunit [Candidatus Bathyarchaeota archaeon]
MAVCILALSFVRDVNEVVFSTDKGIYVYSGNQVALLNEFAKSIENAREAYASTLHFPPECKFNRQFECELHWWKFFYKFFSRDPIPGLLLADPIFGYNLLLWEQQILKQRHSEKYECKRCMEVILRTIQKVKQSLRETRLIKYYEKNRKLIKYLDRKSVYKTFFYSKCFSPKGPYPSPVPKCSGFLLDSYEVGPYKVKVYNCTDRFIEPVYSVTYLIPPTLKKLIVEVASTLENRVEPRLEVAIPIFQELIKNRIDEALSLLKAQNLDLRMDALERAAQLAAYKSLHMVRVMPLLLDENVEEIFLDNPADFIYLDHRKWGRCRSNLNLSKREIIAIQTRLRASSGSRLDFATPSLKAELSTESFQTRFSVDIHPLAVDGFHLDIRKLRKRYFTLPELVENGTLTSEAAAYLYFCLIRKRNITVIGEPGAGKTTLINALDLTTPPEWRKITVEDVVESIAQTSLGNHQTRLKVEPFESFHHKSRKKSTEIIKLLHRAPDWIYLGEIQTAEHSKAMFHALSTGLRGLQTCHAASPEQAIIRWVIHHEVPIVCMFDLDILIHIKKLMLKGCEFRKVVRICEIKPPDTIDKAHEVNLAISSVGLQDIFSWNPARGTLERSCDLFTTPVLQRIKRLEFFDKERFDKEINAYKFLFEELARNKIFEVDDVTRIFHRLHAEQLHRECAEKLDRSFLMKIYVGKLGSSV